MIGWIFWLVVLYLIYDFFKCRSLSKQKKPAESHKNHGHSYQRYEESSHAGQLSESNQIKNSLIDSAISNKKRIVFDYTDLNGNKTHREVQPLNFERTEGGAFGVRAYCYLRNAKRTFIINKMLNVKIVGFN